MRKTISTLALISSFFLHPSSFAVKTERWELNTATAFMRGKLQRLSVASEGELRLGYGSTKLGEFAKAIWCSTVAKDGTIYFGTGTPADVYAISPDNKATRLFETESIAVTALATDSHGNLFVATLAEGKIFKSGADRKGAEFCKLRAPYIWALVADAHDNLYAGTGPDGRVYRITPDGKADEWYVSEESNILSLALDADGSLLAGGSDRGLLYRITGKTQGTVLHEFAEDEVKSLAFRGRDLYVGVNKQKIKRPRTPLTGRRPSAVEFEEVGQRLTAQFGARNVEAGTSGRDTPADARLSNLLDGALYLRNANGRIDHLLNWTGESILSMALDAAGGIIVGTAGQGRVYRVTTNAHWEMLFDLDEKQALTVAARNGHLAFIGAGNVGNGYLIDTQKAADGEYLTEVRDCKFLTTWGNLSWMGLGQLAIATRTGNTALPDATWSAWSDPLPASPSKVTSPRARFVQLRATLARTTDPALQSLTLYLQGQNQKPEISSIDTGEKTKSAEPAKPTGTETNATADLAKLVTEDARPKTASPTKRITWRATDKDGDTLIYRLFYQAKGDDVWVPIQRDKPLKKTEYSWDTESIPDGWYRLKVIASDEESNPPGESLAAEKISDLIKIDNTRPAVLQLAFDAATATVTGIARDNLSLIRNLEYSLDGADWKYFTPADGVFDDREESFALKLPALTPGPNSLAVRATDEEGNVGVEKIAIRAK